MSKDYGKTLNLPKTDFPMRANLPQKEPGIQEKWEKQNVYGKMLEKNKATLLSFFMTDRLFPTEIYTWVRLSTRYSRTS